MNIISCSFDCKHQKDGYCFLKDAKASNHQGTDGCIYYDPPEKPVANISNPSNDLKLP